MAIPDEIVQQFRDGFDSEEQLVNAIRAHLMSIDQRYQLFELNISVEDILNGRIEGGNPEEVTSILTRWNQELGFRCFAGGR